MAWTIMYIEMNRPFASTLEIIRVNGLAFSFPFVCLFFNVSLALAQNGRDVFFLLHDLLPKLRLLDPLNTAFLVFVVY